MKRLQFILIALLMAGNAMAMRTVVFNPATDKDMDTGGNVSATSFTLSKDGVTITVSLGTITDSQYRFYANSSVTVSPEIDWDELYEGEYGNYYGRLQKIEFICTSSGTAQYGPGNLDVVYNMPGGEYTWSGNVGTFDADGYNARDNYYLVANSQVRCTEIRVTVYANEEVISLDNALNVTGGNIHFTSQGSYHWITVNEGGRTYAQSGNAGVASSSSVLTATVTISQTYTLLFDFKAWGEGSAYDQCIFSVDGVVQFSYGARQNDWETYSVDLSPGTHTLTWSYTKDSSVNPTGDYFAVDNVALRIQLDPVLNVADGNIHFTTGGDYPWTAVTSGGRTYAQSGNAGIASSSSVLTAIVDVVWNSTLSFDFKAWGEGSSYDVCEFFIDGVQKFKYGARQNDWETYSVDLSPGTHTLTWSYTKDSSVNPTGDYFAVDNVSIRAKLAPLRGDVNGDGNVNITDVTDLIDYLLSGNTSAVNLVAADVNGDNNVNITDVTDLIDYLLSGAWLDETIITVNGVSFKMIYVEAGTFTMGATPEQGPAYDQEKPAHPVALSSYWIGQTEVTQALWKAVMGSNPSHFNTNLQCPVEVVSWDNCQTFISRLNQLTGMKFRIPTEAEWEYAARGGKNSRGYKYAGSNTLDNVAWYNENADDMTHPVAQKAPNELGLYDMSGNVWEWCQDWFGSYSGEAQINPTGPASGTERVMRGGSWNAPFGGCRLSVREEFEPSLASNFFGLRLAL